MKPRDGYIDHGPATRTVRIGTASGCVHRMQDVSGERPACALCGLHSRYSRPVGAPYDLGDGGPAVQDWRCRGCDDES